MKTSNKNKSRMSFLKHYILLLLITCCNVLDSVALTSQELEKYVPQPIRSSSSLSTLVPPTLPNSTVTLRPLQGSSEMTTSTWVLSTDISFNVTTPLLIPSTFADVTEAPFDFIYTDIFRIPLCTYDNRRCTTLKEYAKCVRSDPAVATVLCYQEYAKLPECVPGELTALSFQTHFLNKPYRYYSLIVSCATAAFIHFGIPVRMVYEAFQYYYLIRNENIVDLCLPLFKAFGSCTISNYISTCTDETVNIFFLHGHCKLPSQQRKFYENIVIQAFRSGDSKAVQNLCEDEVEATEEKIKNISFTLFPLGKNSPIYRYAGYDKTTVNRYWPCCYNNYFVRWHQTPELADLYRDWSYLPPECQAGEIVLMGFQSLIAIFSSMGNFIVLSVMLSGGHRYEASCFLRTTLSLTDFLTSIFVIIPALFDSASILNGDMNMRSYVFNSSLNVTNVIDKLNISFSDLHFITYWRENGTSKSAYFFNVNRNSRDLASFQGDDLWQLAPVLFNYANGLFYVVRAHALCLCSCVTIILMFFLSVERFILCWRPLKYKQLFTLPRVKAAILIALLFGVTSLVVISYGRYVTVYWNGWTKLAYGILDTDLLYNEPVKIISSILCSFGILTIVFSVMALFAFFKEVDRITEERKSMDMRIIDDFVKENVYITVSLLIIAAFYVVAYVPVGISVLSDHEQHLETKYPIMFFLSWWILLAGSAVNPFIYNMRSHLFRSDMAESLYKILPEPFKSRIKPYITHSPNKTTNYIKYLDKRAQATGEQHNGLPKGSKLADLGFGFNNQTSKI